MDRRVSSTWQELEVLASEYRRMRFATISGELQASLCERLEDLHQRSITVKAEVVSVGDEEGANALLCAASLAEAFRCEILMWMALRQGDAHSAWENLLRAQDSATVALRAHKNGTGFEEDLRRLQVLEHLVFPQQRYTSLGLIVKSSTCSICGGEYGECGHVAGRSYMGKVCSRILSDIEIREISIVGDPANKHARITAISGDGVMRDTLTLKPVTSEDANP